MKILFGLFLLLFFFSSLALLWLVSRHNPDRMARVN
jgi:hypothetical protein